MTNTLQHAKRAVRAYQNSFDACPPERLATVLADVTAPEYRWRGMHPFNEQNGATAVAEEFWIPLRTAFSALQRREDVFFAGSNIVDDNETIWVASMGHMLGLFDNDWLGIPATKRIAVLPYAEFHQVEDHTIVESAFFCDIIKVMQQAGHHPLPPQTGAGFVHPGPRTHDGILDEAQDPDEGRRTSALINRMVADLTELNRSGDNRCPPELLAKTWHEDMLWYGPAGIGATYTIPRYQQQHQYPFRCNLADKVFNGHVARIAEGNYAGFFGWPNLTNTPSGGFLGLPGNQARADMRVVDIYRRDGDKLAENWVFIDLLHWLAMQGLDVLARLRELRGID
jgi:hypothetical protein